MGEDEVAYPLVTREDTKQVIKEREKEEVAAAVSARAPPLRSLSPDVGLA